MIPPAFDCHAPKTVGKAILLLGSLGSDAKLLAGGHSLLPMMKLRFAAPAHLIDINRIPASPHHPIGAKGVAESPRVGGISTFTSAVVDASAHLGVTDLTMPHSSYRVWPQLKKSGVAL